MRKLYLACLVSLLGLALFTATAFAEGCPGWLFVYGTGYNLDCRGFVGGTGENFTQATVQGGGTAQTLIIRKENLFMNGESFESFYLVPTYRDTVTFPGATAYFEQALPLGFSVRLEIVDQGDGRRSLCVFRSGGGGFNSPITASCPNNAYLPGVGAFAVLTVEKNDCGTGGCLYAHGVAVRHGSTPVPTATRTNTPPPESPTPTATATPNTTSCGGFYDWRFLDGSGVLSNRALITAGVEYVYCPNPSALPIPSMLITSSADSSLSSDDVSIVSQYFEVFPSSPSFGVSYKAYSWNVTDGYYIGHPDGGRIDVYMEVGGSWELCGYSVMGNTGDIDCFLPAGGTTRLRVDVFAEEPGGYGVDVGGPGSGGGCPTIGGLDMDFRPSTVNCCVVLSGSSPFTTTQGRTAYQVDFPQSVTGYRGAEIGTKSGGGTLAGWTYQYLGVTSNRAEMCNTGAGTCGTNTVFVPNTSGAVLTIGSTPPHNSIGFYDESVPFPNANPAYTRRTFTVELCSPQGSQATATPTVSPTPTRTPSATGTPPPPTATFPPQVATNTPTLPAGVSPSPTRTRTPNPSHSPTATLDPSVTPSATNTPLGFPTPSRTPTATPTIDPSAPTFTPTPTVTPSPVLTPTPYAFPTPTGEGPAPGLDFSVITGHLEDLGDLVWTRWPFYLVSQAWEQLGFADLDEPEPLVIPIINPIGNEFDGSDVIELTFDFSPHPWGKQISAWVLGILCCVYLLNKVYSLGISNTTGG